MALFFKLVAGILAVLVVVLFYGIFIERYLVRFPRYKISVPNLPSAFEGLTIVHISDAHLSALVPGWFLKRLFMRVATIEKKVFTRLLKSNNFKPLDDSLWQEWLSEK